MNTEWPEWLVVGAGTVAVKDGQVINRSTVAWIDALYITLNDGTRHDRSWTSGDTTARLLPSHHPHAVRAQLVTNLATHKDAVRAAFERWCHVDTIDNAASLKFAAGQALGARRHLDDWDQKQAGGR